MTSRKDTDGFEDLDLTWSDSAATAVGHGRDDVLTRKLASMSDEDDGHKAEVPHGSNKSAARVSSPATEKLTSSPSETILPTAKPLAKDYEYDFPGKFTWPAPWKPARPQHTMHGGEYLSGVKAWTKAMGFEK